jgi:hypothetical protein
MEDYVPGEIIVSFYHYASLKEADMIINDLGLSVKSVIDSRMMYLVAVPVGSEQKWVEDFKKLTFVKFAQCNRSYGFGALVEP